jgi:3-(3-hydroxy-phenyl)propionate hydroxylase
VSALVAPDATSGTLSRQVVGSDDVRSDDLVGHGFGLFVTDSLLAELAPGIRARIDDLAGPLTVVGGDAADRYLEGTGASFALVRPDRYLLGLGSTSGELAASLDRLPLSTTVGMGAGA